MRQKKYTDEDFIRFVKESYSIRQLLIKLNLKPSGGNYALAKKRIKDLELDNSHFKGQGHLKGATHNWAPKIPLVKILIKNSVYGGGTYKLKKRLIKEGYLKNKCYRCGISTWQGQKLPLELDHINGDRYDNRIENLTILCPNCHSLTPTYRAKNINGGKRIEKKYYCKECNKEISYSSKSGLCVKCSHKRFRKKYYCKECNKEITKKSKSKLCLFCSIKNNRKVKNRPSKEQLLKEIKETNYCVVGRKYNVSDNTIRKWIK